MVSSNLMDAIDYSLRINRNRQNEPFGGVQIVMVGDLFQLPPVVESKAIPYYNTNYGGGVYFFNAPVFNNKGFDYLCVKLTEPMRQKEEFFISFLNRLRINKTTFDDMVLLNSRHVNNLNFIEKDAVTFTARRKTARDINKKKLEMIKAEEFLFKANLSGTIKDKYEKFMNEFNNNRISQEELEKKLESNFPTDIELKLKKGALVVMIKNDSGGRWVNGSVGVINKLDINKVFLNIKGKTYKIEEEKWEDNSYEYDPSTNELSLNSKGSFIQYPIRLAWALTIHKSQGMTFDKIIIDLAGGAFVHGQTYVALSRCKSLEGISLNREIKNQDIIVDENIVEYYKTKCCNNK